MANPTCHEHWAARGAELIYAGDFPDTSAAVYHLAWGGWATAYVYVLLDAEGQYLYVGRARVPGNRFSHHRRHKEWWPDVTDLIIARVSAETRYETDCDVNSLEVATIQELDPIYNIIGKRARRHALVQG